MFMTPKNSAPELAFNPISPSLSLRSTKWSFVPVESGVTWKIFHRGSWVQTPPPTLNLHKIQASSCKACLFIVALNP